MTAPRTTAREMPPRPGPPPAEGAGLREFRRWLIERALPCWATDGHDADRGTFQERLDRAGCPLDVPRRAMVQARQVYVFAHAGQLGWWPGGAALADAGFAALVATYVEQDARTASVRFSATAEGQIVSDVRDAYTHAFFLFALAWLFRTTGARDLLALADKVIAFVDEALIDPLHGGLFDAAPAVDRSKRQNPMMHLLEAYLALAEASGAERYLARADRLVDLACDRLLTGDPAVLPEYFAQNWSPCPNRPRIFEPGHHLEWAWLLTEHARLSGTPVRGAARALHATALRHGRAPTGHFYDAVDHDLRASVRSTRLWPHCEAIKAAVVRPTGAAADLVLAEQAAAVLLDSFLDRPFAGGWIDHLAENGTPLVNYVPASSLYHLFLAGAEADRHRAADAAAGAHPDR